jgi:hypothetical protein
MRCSISKSISGVAKQECELATARIWNDGIFSIAGTNPVLSSAWKRFQRQNQSYSLVFHNPQLESFTWPLVSWLK